MITWRQIFRGLLRKFLPAAAVTSLVLDVPSGSSSGASVSFVFLAIDLIALSVGYVSVLGALKSRLREDAEVTGRRSIVAGIASLGLIVAGAAVFRLGTPSVWESVARMVGFNFATGGIVTLGLYFPWIGARRIGVGAPPSMAELQSADSSLLNEIPYDHADERHSVRHDGLERR